MLWKDGQTDEGHFYNPPSTWRWGIKSALSGALFNYLKRMNICLFLYKDVCYGYSLKVPCGGISNEYPQHVFVEKLGK